jgi:hypothetical protein
VPEETARITLTRLVRPLGDPFRRYKVFVDDEQVGVIRRRETKTYEVEPGPHQLHLELAWALFQPSDVRRSKAAFADVAPGEELKFTCKARATMGVLGGMLRWDHITVTPIERVHAPGATFGPAKPEPAPGAPSDEELRASWEAWVGASDRATELRRSLQTAIASGHDAEADRLKSEVRDLLSERKGLAAEYQRLKALRPDWDAPAR